MDDRLSLSSSGDGSVAAKWDVALPPAPGDGVPAPGDQPVELQHLWMRVLSRRLSCIAIVPVRRGGSAGALARDLAEVGARLGGRVELFAGEGATRSHAERLAEAAGSHVAAGGLAVVTVDPLNASDGVLPLVLAADAAVVVVELGSVTIATVRAVVDAIGRDRVLGCVAVGGG